MSSLLCLVAILNMVDEPEIWLPSWGNDSIAYIAAAARTQELTIVDGGLIAVTDYRGIVSSQDLNVALRSGSKTVPPLHPYHRFLWRGTGRCVE